MEQPLGFAHFLNHADAVAWLILSVMLLASVTTWTLIVGKGWRMLRTLRRSQTFLSAFWAAPDLEAVVKVRDIEIHPGRHEVRVAGELVEMTVSELRILHLLAGRPGWVMTREQIVDAVKGEDYAVTDRAVDVQIVGIRRKLGDRADCIETVRGVGYRFRDED